MNLTESTLSSMYIDQMKSWSDISKELDISVTTLSKYTKRFGISSRGSNEGIQSYKQRDRAYFRILITGNNIDTFFQYIGQVNIPGYSYKFVKE